MHADSSPGQTQQQPDIKRLQCLEHHHVATSARTGQELAGFRRRNRQSFLLAFEGDAPARCSLVGRAVSHHTRAYGKPASRYPGVALLAQSATLTYNLGTNARDAQFLRQVSAPATRLFIFRNCQHRAALTIPRAPRLARRSDHESSSPGPAKKRVCKRTQ
jgi:hypothetical protein